MTHSNHLQGSSGTPSESRRSIRSILDDPLTQIPLGHILDYARLDHEDPLDNHCITAFTLPVKGYIELMQSDAWDEVSRIISKYAGAPHDESSGS